MTAPEPIPPPPWKSLYERLEAAAAALEARGDRAGAGVLRGLTEHWWQEQTAWCENVANVLTVHHEINNALVGIRGNAQLLMMNPATQHKGVRERLEVVLRESGRIQEAAGRLRDLKTGLGGGPARARAA